MKLTKKIISVVAAASMLTAVAFADDFGFDFSEGDSGFDFGDGGDSSSSGGIGNVISAINWTGDANLEGRLYVDQRDGNDDRYDFKDFPTAVFPSFNLGMEYTGAYTDFSGKLKFDKFSLGDYKQDILEEFTARVYVNSNVQLEAGKMKVVWGKGDKLHVLDNFNANDYTDYIIPDYIGRRIAEPMFRAVYTTKGGIKFEGIYTPTMTADRLATSGAWKPKAMTSLEDNVKSIIAAQLQAAMTADNTGALVDYASFSADDLYPDTWAFKYGQAGIRSTFTIGQVDLGASYYYGHYKQVSANVESMVNANVVGGLVAAYPALADMLTANADLPTLEYDRVNIFGLELATIIWRFNTRAELAYNLTADTAGDDPWVHNNSLNWIFGFDIDLPIHNINVNVQNQGKYTLHYDKLDDEKLTYLAGTPYEYAYSLKAYDVDYNGGHATNNKIVVAITDTWDHEKTKLDVKGIWGIERKDVIVMPKLSRTIFDDFSVSLSGMFIWCKDEDSEFDGWEHNSFVTLGARYQF